MLTYGKGVDGRLGHGLEYTRCEESTRYPKKVHTLAKMSTMKIVCAKDSSAALTDTGNLLIPETRKPYSRNPKPEKSEPPPLIPETRNPGP